MIVLTAVLAVSVVGIAVMLGYKAIESRNGGLFKFTHIVSSGDKFINRFVLQFKEQWLNCKNAGIEFLFRHMPRYSLIAIRKTKFVIDAKYAEMKESMRGKYVIKNRGMVSVFLRNISEGKR